MTPVYRNVSIRFSFLSAHADTSVGLFIEWAKAKARASRWSEEVELICEEMRRAITYCTWKANWWQSRAGQRPDASPEVREGLRAYALQHAQEEKALAARWSTGWKPALDAAKAFMEEDLPKDAPQEGVATASSSRDAQPSSATLPAPAPAPTAPPRIPAFLDITLDGEDILDDEEEAWDEEDDV